MKALSRTRGAQRPAGWGKEYALDLVKDRSNSLRGHLRRIAGPMGVGWRALYQEIARWKDNDEEFCDAYLEAMGPRTIIGNGAPAKFTEDKQLQFLEAYHDTGQKEAAANAVGMSVFHIEKIARESSRFYDPVFARNMAIVKAQLNARNADNLVSDADNSRTEGDYKTSSKITQFMLERQHPEEWGRKAHLTHEVRGKVQHEHKFSAEDAHAEMADALRRRFESRGEPAAIEAEVIRDG